jgi:hypothetical protein
VVFLALLLFAGAILFGIWRGFGPIQWIWLLFGAAMVMIVIWVLLIILVVEPEMRRYGPAGGGQGAGVAGVALRAWRCRASRAAGPATRPGGQGISPAPGREGDDGRQRASRYLRLTSSQFTVFHHASR